MSDATTTTPAVPTMPYTVATVLVGPGTGKAVDHKVYPGGVPGDYLNLDEVAVMAYVRHLEAERDRLAADLEAATTPASPAADAAKKGKGAK